MRSSKTVQNSTKPEANTTLPSPEPTKRRGRRPDPIIEHPEPLFNDWIEPTCFDEALCLHMARHGDTYYRLWRAIIRPGEKMNHHTIRSWSRGERVPRSIDSFELLARMEHRYRLPAGYFRKLLPHQARAPAGHKLDGIAPAEQRRLAWHLPGDFNERPVKERDEIVAWVRQNILFGSTDYRRYQAVAVKQHYAILFPALTGKRSSTDASYDQTTIYETWRLTIQRYGIWNPYTERGVIKGLLPHGPHNVRDVLATHILKQTGSYEQASYAIQDTPEMVVKHYGRFFPQDKAALAANILNQVWQAA